VARLTFDILRGKLKENASVTAMKVTEVDLHFPKVRHDIRCVMDGELLPMKRDVKLKVHAGELKVLVRQPQERLEQVQAQDGSTDRPASI
jgi:diacylglycerol kinase family enzyme